MVIIIGKIQSSFRNDLKHTAITRRVIYELIKRRDAVQRAHPLLVNICLDAPGDVLESMYKFSYDRIMISVNSKVTSGDSFLVFSADSLDCREFIIAQKDLVNLSERRGVDVEIGGFTNINPFPLVNTEEGLLEGHSLMQHINVSGRKKELIFCGTFNSFNQSIIKDSAKWAKVADLACYDSDIRSYHQAPMVITDCVVIQLTRNGWEIIEIAPGLDIKNDVEKYFSFPISVSPRLKKIPDIIYSEEKIAIPFES